MRNKMLRWIVIGVVAACMSGSAQAQSWDTLEDLPMGRSRLAVVHWNGMIFAIGGQETGIACSPRLDVYDLQASGWSRKADAPVALCGHAAVSHEGKIYVFGGFAGAFGTDRVLVYDPRNDVWTTAADMPTRRVMHAAALAGNGMIYVFGGQDTGAALSDVDELDPATGTWRKVASLPAPRTGLAAAADCKGTIYALGGHGPSTSQGGTTEGSLFEYDPGSDSWTSLAPMPMPRANLAAAGANDGRIYALGGNFDTFETADVQVYDVAAGTWSPGPALPIAKLDLAAVTVGTRIFALGGSSKFGGMLASHHALGPVQLAAFCRLPCGTGPPDRVVRGGLRDDFAPPVDPASPRPALQALIPPGTAAGFDDPRRDRHIGHTLELPKDLRSFPSQIVRAELEVRMRPNHSLANNDGLALGIDADGTFTFSMLIENLPEAQGSWREGDPATDFRLDLGALPDGSDLLPKIDAERVLDFRVQDDTTVDYVQVALWTCPRPLVVDGSNTNPILNTDAFSLPDGAVRFRPQVEGDLFGFAIEVGGAQGVCAAVSSHCPAGGAVGDLLATVLVEDIFNQDHELRFVQAADGIALEVDPPPFGLHMVKAGLSGERGDEIVAERLTTMGGALAVLPPDACVSELDWVEPNCHRVLLTEPVPVMLLPGGPTVTADVVHVCWDAIFGVGGGIERFSVELAGDEPLDLQGVAVQQFGLFSMALGTARLEASAGQLLVRELGASGQDGIAVSLPDVESVDLDFAPLEVGEPLPVGAFIEVGAQGRFEGVPDQSLGSVRIEKTGENEGLLVSADFAEVGSPTQRIQVLSGGQLVVDLPGHLGPVGRSSNWPIGLGKLFPLNRTKCIRGDFPPSTLFSIDGVDYAGDELRVLADGADGTVGTISELSLRTSGIPEITLTSAETIEASCIPDATTHCLADGRFEVTVDWQDFQGGSGVGQALPLTSDTGMFWFFHPANIELVVKVLDARAVNGHFWVFYGALSNVPYTIHVRDTQSGATRTYVNASGSFASQGDTAAFPGDGAGGAPVVRGEDLVAGGAWGMVQIPDDELGAAPFAGAASLERIAGAQGTCAPDATSFCLHGARFRVSSEWATTFGTSGVGQSIPLTSDTGAFWFFDQANVELVVKIIDGRSVNGNWWVFYGSLSNVEFTVSVEDTERNRVLSLFNPQGNFGSRGETELLDAP